MSAAGQDRGPRPHVTTWPVGLGIAATIGGAIAFVVSFVVGREQRLARRLARARPARPRPRAGVLGPRPRRRRGHRRPVPGAARRHRRPGGAGDAARRARLRDHAAELPQQVPDLRRRRVRAQPGRAARRARPVARRQPVHHRLAQGPPARRPRTASRSPRTRSPRAASSSPSPRAATTRPSSQVVLLHFVNGDFVPQPGRESWSPENFVAYSRVCTHAGCPVAEYADVDQMLRLPVPPVGVRRAARRRARRRPGGAAAAAAAAGDRQGRLPLRAERLHRERRPRLLGRHMNSDAGASTAEDGDHDLKRGLGSAFGVRTSPLRPAGALARHQPGRQRPAARGAAPHLPGQLGVLPRRDRPVLLHHPRRHRHLPGAVLPGVGGAGRLRGLLRAARRRRDVHRLRLGAATSASTCPPACWCGRCTTGRRSSSSAR